MSGPVAARLPDGRLHLQHGPIDLLIEAFGAEKQVTLAYQQAIRAFQNILPDLAEELALLRRQAGPDPIGVVAKRMADAVRVHHKTFVTPMAAVAGAVADEMLARLLEGRELDRAYVNNGGDIALHLDRGHSFSIAVSANKDAGRIAISSCDPARGIATSGWRGRSHSLGIADAVTVLAHNAATADVAATLIANAVNLPGHPAIRREKATAILPDSDLGDKLVTTGVGLLAERDVSAALTAGLQLAHAFKRNGKIIDALLILQNQYASTHHHDPELIHA